jgi:NADH-quinone oxidoreductase subunit A
MTMVTTWSSRTCGQDRRGKDGAGVLQAYLPLVLLFVLAGGFAVFSVTIAPLIGPRRYNKAKLDAYECGVEPSPQPVVGGGRMPVAYYLTAMLFILFDIEMVFLYPFAVSADALGMFGLVEIVLFIATLGFAFAYVWRRGGLDWN